MRFFQQRRLNKTSLRIANLGLAFSLLVGHLPTATALAAPNHQQAATATASVALCKAPATNPGNRIFLPLISQLGTADMTTNDLRTHAAEAVTIPRQLRYQIGKRYRYEWSAQINTKTLAHSADGTQDKAGTTTILHAFVDVTMTERATDGVFSGEVSVRDLFFCNTDGAQELLLNDEEMTSALQKPMRFKQAANGIITAVAFPPDTTDQVKNLQKTILNALQVTLREGENSYTAEETGGQGTVNVKYKVEEKDNHLAITKSYELQDFTTLNMQGDESKSLVLKTTTSVSLDGEQGVPTVMETQEELASAPKLQEANPPGRQVTGITLWSEVASTQKFSLTAVNEADTLEAAGTSSAPYTEETLMASLAPQIPNRTGIDLTTVDLNKEFSQFESEPDNPERAARMLDLIDADSTVVLAKVNERLQRSAADEELAKRYIDLLAAVGTPAAQELLAGVLGNSMGKAADLAATMSITVQEQALLDLVLVSSPTMTTVNTIKALSSNQSAALQETAVTVLGAAIGNLADENASAANELAADLVARLTVSQDPASVQLYLDALGNAGLPETLNTIIPYITGTLQLRDTNTLSDTEGIRLAALTALRKMPGTVAEQALVAALNNTSEADGVKMQVANVLATRPDLSPQAASVLDGYLTSALAAPGRYVRDWSRPAPRLGNSRLGIEFPGAVTLANTSSTQFYLYAYQKANALIWYRTWNVLTGELVSRRNGIGQFFGAYLSLGGNRIRKRFEETVPCHTTRSGNLWRGHLTFVDVSTSIPVLWFITIDLSGKILGYASLDYNFAINICNPAASSASATITPSAWARAIGEGALSLTVVRGGVGVRADLLRTSLPIAVSAAYANNNFRLCTTVKITTQPLSGQIYGFADTRRKIAFAWPPFRWKREFQGVLAPFSTPAYAKDILNYCF